MKIEIKSNNKSSDAIAAYMRNTINGFRSNERIIHSIHTQMNSCTLIKNKKTSDFVLIRKSLLKTLKKIK